MNNKILFIIFLLGLTLAGCIDQKDPGFNSYTIGTLPTGYDINNQSTGTVSHASVVVTAKGVTITCGSGYQILAKLGSGPDWAIRASCHKQGGCEAITAGATYDGYNNPSVPESFTWGQPEIVSVDNPNFIAGFSNQQLADNYNITNAVCIPIAEASYWTIS